MALSVELYRVVGKGKDRRYVPIDLGRRGRRSKEEVTGNWRQWYGCVNEHNGWFPAISGWSRGRKKRSSSSI